MVKVISQCSNPITSNFLIFYFNNKKITISKITNFDAII